MQAPHLIEQLVELVAPNASVIEISEDDERYRVILTGTTGVTAHCDVPRGVVDSAVSRQTGRRRLARLLKQCADTTVATVPDGRA